MAPGQTLAVQDVRFEQYLPEYTLGVDETLPRLSWKVSSAGFKKFEQTAYAIEIYEELASEVSGSSEPRRVLLLHRKVESSLSYLVPWPSDEHLRSRQRIFVRVMVWSSSVASSWSKFALLETGLLRRDDWRCERITGVGSKADTGQQSSEILLRKQFKTRYSLPIVRARLYIAVQGVYEAEINGRRVGNDFLAPGWTIYNRRLRYQTYDISELLASSSSSTHCIGVRLAEGWFSGRLGFMGGMRNIWGSCPAVMAQLEIRYADGHEGCDTICSDGSWESIVGPVTLAELYDGEKYDARLEIQHWSAPISQGACTLAPREWKQANVMQPLSAGINLIAGWSEPVRRVEVIYPLNIQVSASGKMIVDFGQNLVGYVRMKRFRGTRGNRISLYHAEVLENGELSRRPLRICEALDQYICSGAAEGEEWEPRFTFHGFRYLQVDGWPEGSDLLKSLEAVVCHTDMEPAGTFACSNKMLNKLYQNAVWSMRGNFLSIPTDCPQRDERLGWTGDIAQFAHTATKLFNCFNMLKDWMVDVAYDQESRGGIPALVTPNVIHDAGIWSKVLPVAVWHDVTTLVPWALYKASGDTSILGQQYHSMKTWVDTIPRNKENRLLWDPSSFQLGDWLDPTASPDTPMNGKTDRMLVADAFLIRSLDIISQTAGILGLTDDRNIYKEQAAACRKEFACEYVTANGRVSSESQTSYSLAICFNLLPTKAQKVHAGERLATIVRQNEFKIGTGFAGTPFILEALTRSSHEEVAYSMLLCQECPSWLYPVAMGATTMWERWDSMLPNGTVNPGEMTSFNHYCFGSVATFLHERVAGLQQLEPGWKRTRAAPCLSGSITHASASHLTPFGFVSCSWKIESEQIHVEVVVPPTTTMEVVIPSSNGAVTEVRDEGNWSFSLPYIQEYEWPVRPIPLSPE